MRIRNDFYEPSLFTAENLLREARRQKSIAKRPIPRVCILDPDGDIVRYLFKKKIAVLNESWSCYHTCLYDFKLGRIRAGIVGCAVGAPFAVLVAEEMFVSGCELLISITSAGKLHAIHKSARFLLIAKSLRDEGTSDDYLPPSDFIGINERLLKGLSSNLASFSVPVVLGTAWTTDAPFRETKSAMAWAIEKSADCVEMESAALYSYAKAKNKKIVCLAHLTNTMAQSEGDFEKGVEN